MLTFEDIEGVFALMPTPSLPAASDPGAGFTVDLREAARGASALVNDGVNAIMLTGTFGEASTLTDDEWTQFTGAVVKSVKKRVPVLAGTTTLNTRDTIRRAKTARDLGADGMLLGRPMWCELSQEGIVQFYRDVATAVPDLGIVVYNNPVAFKGLITLEAWEALSEIDNVIGCKHTPIDERRFGDEVRVTRGRIRLMPIDEDWYSARLICPGDAPACWSVSASCDPYPVLLLRDALRAGDLARAKDLAHSIREASKTLFPNGDAHTFFMHNIPLDKAMIDAAGYMKAGPARPPYHVVPEEYLESARLAGRKWRELALRLRADNRQNVLAPSRASS